MFLSSASLVLPAAASDIFHAGMGQPGQQQQRFAAAAAAHPPGLGRGRPLPGPNAVEGDDQRHLPEEEEEEGDHDRRGTQEGMAAAVRDSLLNFSCSSKHSKKLLICFVEAQLFLLLQIVFDNQKEHDV